MPAVITKATPQFRGNGEVRLFTEADSQVIRQDDFVKITSGKVAVVATADGDYDSTAAKILGVARSVGRNTTNPGQLLSGEVSNLNAPITDFSVYTCDDDTFEVLLPLYASTGGTNAQPQDVAVGQSFVLCLINGIWAANVLNTTNPNLVLVEKYEGQASTEFFGSAWFRIPLATRFAGI